MIKADVHAGRFRARLDGGQLAVDQPLQPAAEHDLALMLAGKFRNGGTGGVAEALRPVRPDPEVRIGGMQVGVERAVGGVQAKEVALRGNPVPAGGGGRRGTEDLVENAQFQRRDGLVLHGFRGPQALELGMERRRFDGATHLCVTGHCFHVQIQEVAVEDAVGQIRALVVGCPVVDGVQGVERDEIHVQRRHGPVDQVAEVAEVAAAPIAVGANAIEGDAKSRAFAGANLFGRGRRHDQPHGRAVRADFVVAERQVGGKFGSSIGDRRGHILRLTRFEGDFEIERGRRGANGEPNRLPGSDNQNLRQKPVALFFFLHGFGKLQGFG